MTKTMTFFSDAPCNVRFMLEIIIGNFRFIHFFWIGNMS
jgi:hypothetical protein